ncbi:MAG: GAF domain-containing protein, partial [Phycisphaerales bacterium]
MSSHQEYETADNMPLPGYSRGQLGWQQSAGGTDPQSRPSPGGSMPQLADIIDCGGVQSLVEDFYRLAHIPMSIIDLQGRVLVGVGWQDICTRFHRVHPGTCRHCIESDTQLSADLAPGDCRLYRCKNNMWDIATPLLVGDRHVGNLFSGQFFFKDEPVDRELFRSQARRYGFDEQEYLAALDAVPRLGRDAVDTGMAFLTKLARMLSQLSFSNAQLAHSLEERGTLMESLRESRERLNRAQEIAHLGSWELDLSTGVLTWSDEVYRLFGLKPQEFEATYEAFLNAIHPDDRAAVDAAYSGSVREGKSSYEIEHRIVRRETGEVRWVREKCQHVKDEAGNVVLSRGMVLDITSRKRQEQHLQRLNRALKVLSHSGQALIHATDEAAYLEEVCQIIARGGYAMTWIGFAEEDENRTVRPVASAGFEEGYLATLHVTWADTERGRGPTGTAIRTGRTQMCRNMLTDPAFAPWREEAIKRGYAASICLPLWDAGKVFGALTIYETEPESFTEDDVRLLTELAGDLAFGITSLRLRTANAQAARDLLHSEERFRLLSETAGRLLTSEDPQGIVNSLCRNVMKHLDCQVFFNFLVDTRAGRLRLNACEGIPQEEARKIELLDYGVAVCGCVARDGVRIVSEDIAVVEDPRTDLVRSYGVQAYACHPLIAEGKVLGTLSFGTTTRKRFSEDDLSLMKTVADQVAVAMQRISSQKERQHHLDFHVRLLRMTRDILDVADLQTVLQMVADASVELTGAKLGAAGHGFIDGRPQVQAVSYGPDAPLCQMEGGFSVVKGGVHMDLTGSKESIRLTDEELHAHSAWWGLPQGHVPLRGLLAARLLDADGRANGMIMVSDKTEGDFSEEDEVLLRQVATIASLAIRLIEARDEAQRRAQEALEAG